MKKQKKQNNIFLLLIAVVIIVIGSFVFLKTTRISNSTLTIKQEKLTHQYTSNAINISFQYPQGWYVDEKNKKTVVTSYSSQIGDGIEPTERELRITIITASLCQPTLDEDVLKGGCGEEMHSRNTILSKSTKEYSGGTFITYAIQYSTGEKDTFYYLQKGDRILQISKQPDPSQFENEFEKIISSIEFL